MSEAGIAAVSEALLTKVVGREAPFQRTSEAATKPVPVTVSVSAGPPAKAALGVNPEVAGAGCSIVKARLLEVPPAWLTVTVAAPEAAMSEAGINAVIMLLLTNVLGRAAPFQSTTAVVVKS